MKAVCIGRFTSSKNAQLLLTTEDALEIWQEEEEHGSELTLIYNQPLQAGAAVVAPFHVPGWLQEQRDGLVAISESGDFQLLHWDDRIQRLQALCHIPNALPSDTAPLYNSLCACAFVALGSALCCLIAGRDGKVTFAVVQRGTKAPIRYTAIFHEVSPGPLTEHHTGHLGSPLEVLSLSFLLGKDGQPETDLHGRLLLAQLIGLSALDGASISLTVSALDTKMGELQQCWQIRDLDDAARAMLKLPGTATEKHGQVLLLSDSGAIAYNHEGNVSKRIAYRLQGRLSAAALISPHMLLIGDTEGSLLTFDLSVPGAAPRHLPFRQEDIGTAGIQALHAVCHGDVTRPAVFRIRDNCQASLIRLRSSDGLCLVKHVPSRSLSPVHDFAVVHPWEQESVFFLAHGRGRHGSLTRVQDAAQLTIEDHPAIKNELTEVPALLPFVLPADDSRVPAAVILSYEASSKVFHKNGTSTWQALIGSGFDGAHRTLAVGTTDDVKKFVQVTSEGVRLVSALPPYALHHEERANDKMTRGLQLVDVCGSKVVAAGMDQLLTYAIEGGKIRTVSNRTCENQISALSFSIQADLRASNGSASSSSRDASSGKKKETKGTSSSLQRVANAEETFVVVGYWTSHAVEVLRWPELQVVTRVALGDADRPRSLKLLSTGGVKTLLVGTAEGSVICYESRGEGFHTGPSWRVRVGLSPVSFSVLPSRTLKHAQLEHEQSAFGNKDKLPKSRGAISIYANSNSGLLFSFEPALDGSLKVLSARISGSEGLHHVAASEGGTCLVVSQDGQVKEASLDRSAQARRRTFALRTCPMLVASHVPSGCLIVACASEQNAHSLRVIHAQSLAELADISLSRGHVPTCLQSLALPLYKSGPERKDFIVLASTRFVEESAQSVLSVFAIEERPAGEDQVEFRLVLLGAYSPESIICSLASIDVAIGERIAGEATSDESTFEEVGDRKEGLGALPMLALGFHDGLQILSNQVDTTGEGHVAVLEERMLREAMGDLYNSTCLDESVGQTSEERKSEDCGLLKVRVEAEVKLTAAVTSLSGRGNVLFAGLADKSMLVYEVLQTPTGVQLRGRSRAELGSPPYAIMALSKERAIVGTHRKARVLERNLEAEAAYIECERIAAVRLSETRGVDLTEAAEPLGSSASKKSAKLPLLERRGPESVARKPIVGFCEAFKELVCGRAEGSNMSCIAVLDDGSVEPKLAQSCVDQAAI